METTVSCEVEIKKRGLHFHDMGHGWTAEPFGLDSSGAWEISSQTEITPELREMLSMLDGERKVRKSTGERFATTAIEIFAV